MIIASPFHKLHFLEADQVVGMTAQTENEIMDRIDLVYAPTSGVMHSDRRASQTQRQGLNGNAMKRILFVFIHVFVFLPSFRNGSHADNIASTNSSCPKAGLFWEKIAPLNANAGQIGRLREQAFCQDMTDFECQKLTDAASTSTDPNSRLTPGYTLVLGFSSPNHDLMDGYALRAFEETGEPVTCPDLQFLDELIASVSPLRPGALSREAA